VVLDDMKYLHELCSKSHDFTLMLRSPIIKSDKKLTIVKAVLKDHLNALSNSFLELLIKKGREFFLPEMTEAYMRQYKELKHIHEIRLTTAIQINEDLYQSIKDKVAASLNDGSVDLKLKVDKELIGGFVLEAGDKLFDASIRRDLNDIKKQFTQNLYVAEI
jgi:F-type H+-transporting ATPase subunit delta